MTYRAAAMFTLHQINAFEENGFLVMDMCCGDNGEVIGDFTLENLRRESGEEIDKVNAHRTVHTKANNNKSIHLIQLCHYSCDSIAIILLNNSTEINWMSNV